MYVMCMHMYVHTYICTGCMWLWCTYSDCMYICVYVCMYLHYICKENISTYNYACVSVHTNITLVDSDYTLYPFSTQNAQDFKNLLSVYTDAVFFPNLREIDFRYVHTYVLGTCIHTYVHVKTIHHVYYVMWHFAMTCVSYWETFVVNNVYIYMYDCVCVCKHTAYVRYMHICT